jgi:hypothetical protein
VVTHRDLEVRSDTAVLHRYGLLSDYPRWHADHRILVLRGRPVVPR